MPGFEVLYTKLVGRVRNLSRTEVQLTRSIAPPHTVTAENFAEAEVAFHEQVGLGLSQKVTAIEPQIVSITQLG